MAKNLEDIRSRVNLREYSIENVNYIYYVTLITQGKCSVAIITVVDDC